MFNLQDENDNSPVFESSNYVFNIMENLSPGYVLGFVSATDRDSGTNGQVVYSNSTHRDLVHVNSSTGELTLLFSPNFESLSSISFDVRKIV